MKHAATNSVAQRLAYGRLNGTAAMTALLDGDLMPVTTVGANDFYEWRAQMALQPGAHKLIVNALNWSGLYTASATNTFTNNAADRVQNSYGGNGQVTNRAWISSGGATNASQTLSWDARDRLHSVTCLDSNTNGYIWSAIYDGLGRRLSTTTVFITNGVTVSSLPKTISQYFDPSARFLELGETDSGVTTWKLYGPDLNGFYGGMQGVGGLEAVVNAPSPASPVVSDSRGNGYAIYNINQGRLSWYSTRVTAYGAVEGYRPLPLADGATMAPASAWRGKWADITGLYWLGHRYYDPIAGNWLSADPLGHDADPSLYAFCAAGDPVDDFDSDGGLATQAGTAATAGTYNAPSQIGMNINPNVFPPQAVIEAPGGPSYVPCQPYWDPSQPSTFAIQSLDTSPYQEFFLQNIVAPAIMGVATGLAGEGLGLLGSWLLGSAEAITAAGADMATVVHYTDEAGMQAISQSGTVGTAQLQAFVTMPSEIPVGSTAADIEQILEIQAGRAQYSITFQTPAANLMTPANGAVTSGGAVQFQLINPVPISPPTFIPTPTP
jgi:RHS repeat-associated protein